MNDVSQFWDVLTAFGGEPGSPSLKLTEFLRAEGLSREAVEHVSRYVLYEEVEVGPVSFYGQADVLKVNAEDSMRIALRNGLLVVGSCPNGDPVAVDVRDRIGATGYLAHEVMWDEASVREVREVFAVLAPGLGALAAGLRDAALPPDYDAATSRRQPP